MTNITNDLLARFDAFAIEFLPDRETMIELICDASNSLNINDSIINLIDSQFDDNFAIICDNDANNESLFIEFIESNRIEFTIYLYARIMQLIA